MGTTQTLTRKLDPKTASGPALRTFFRLADRWHLDVDQQMKLLGVSARSTFFKWKKDADGHLSMDTLERISYLLGIFKSLHILLPVEDAADAWIKKPNTAPIFGGKSALDRMLSGHVSELGDRLVKESSYGIAYDSVRNKGGQCAAIFRPPMLSNCQRERNLVFEWDGKKIGVVYELREYSWGA